MRIVIADYSGHPFQVQLSRALAGRGHSVLHLYFAEFQTPRGRLNYAPDDPQTLAIEPISLGSPFAKQSFIKRQFQEISVGKLFADRIKQFRPDVVVASNLPLDALRIVAKRSNAERRAFVFWQQDIYSVAIERILRDKWGPIGAIIGKRYKSIERHVLQNSQAIVVISDDFISYLKSEFKIVESHIHVLENWAPLNEIVPQSRDNPWARVNGLANKEVVLYTGTLGMKHDPSLILNLALSLASRPKVEIVVVSEGPAADWLSSKARENDLRSLRVMGFQPFEGYSDVLGAADVLISILEPEAGAFSVPSKVLSYLCAGRPIILSAPLENLASRIVGGSGAGVVVQPGDVTALSKAVCRLLDDAQLSKRTADCARRYAEQTFEIGAITSRFEEILVEAERRFNAE